MKNYLSFGGGVNSVALYLLMEQLGIEFEAIAVDHMADWPETYEYTKMFMETGREITVLKPKEHRKRDNKTWQSLYEYCWDNNIFPSTMNRWCTDKFKVKVVQEYIDKPCFMHIGIDAGEAKRAKLSSKGGIENRYLLIEHDIDRDACKKIILDAGLPVPIKSGCYFCPFQRVGQWRKLRKEHPALFCNAEKLEKHCMDYRIKKGAKPYTLRNNGKLLGSMVKNIDKQIALPGMEDLEYPPCQCWL